MELCELGFIGLGKMGLNMVTRLCLGGHAIAAYDRNAGAVADAVEKGAAGAASIEELIGKLARPRAVWIMIPSGAPVDETIEKLSPLLSKGDTIIDGGNSMYKDSMRRAEALRGKGINFLDVGTSGGIWGLREGYCIMVGGEKSVFDRHSKLFKTLAPENGFALMGPSGAGHYVKMIHNGIEYGMLQAYAEGFALMHASEFKLDLERTSKLWNRGSVVRSWILELAQRVFEENPTLDGVKAYVEDSGEGRWTLLDSLDKDVPCPVITLSLLQRFQSRQGGDAFSAKVIAALRHQFGGHKVLK